MPQVTGVCSIVLGDLRRSVVKARKTCEIPGTSTLNKNRGWFGRYIALCRLSFKWDKLPETFGEGKIGYGDRDTWRGNCRGNGKKKWISKGNQKGGGGNLLFDKTRSWLLVSLNSGRKNIHHRLCLLRELTALFKDTSVPQSMKQKKALLAAIGLQGRDEDIGDTLQYQVPKA